MARFADTLLEHLSAEVCRNLLRTAEVGRVGVVDEGRPTVFPVCHVYDGEVLAFPTTEGTKLHAALGWPYVGFEVDGIDDDGSGWSVMVSGRAETVDDTGEQRRLAGLRTAPWLTAPELVWVRIVPDEITGRRVRGVRPGPR